MEARDYKDTLHLPKTSFPMKADLPKREPERLARWLDSGLYEKVLEARRGAGAPATSFTTARPTRTGAFTSGRP